MRLFSWLAGRWACLRGRHDWVVADADEAWCWTLTNCRRCPKVTMDRKAFEPAPVAEPGYKVDVEFYDPPLKRPQTWREAFGPLPLSESDRAFVEERERVRRETNPWYGRMFDPYDTQPPPDVRSAGVEPLPTPGDET